jgi:two-component system LytT family sensor kinase
LLIFKNKPARIAPYLFFVTMVIVIFIALIIAITISDDQQVKARHGVLDLSGYDFKQQKTIKLTGEWEFFWDNFIDGSNRMEPDCFASVPEVWNNYEIAGKKLPPFGYATYRLKVKADKAEQLAIKIQPLSTAYELYIDDERIAVNGLVSKQESGFVPQYMPITKIFTPKSQEFMITVHVSNYVYARGGMWYAFLLGTPSQIQDIDRLTVYRDLFLIGSSAVMMLFCFFVFFLGERNPSLLYFALLAFITALRTMIYGERVIVRILSSFRLIIITEYMTLVWMPVLIVLFLQSLRRSNKQIKATAVIVMIATVMTIVILLAPIHIFTELTVFIEVFGISSAIYALFCLLFSSMKLRKMTALSAIILIFCGIYDVLYQSCVVAGYYELSPVGFYIMLNIWAITLARGYTEAIRNMKISLEQAHRAEIAFLQAQIKPHFLYNTLNVIAALCRIDGEYAEKVTMDLAKYLHYTFEFKNLSKYISFAEELDFIETYVKIEKARFVDKFNVVYDCGDVDVTRFMVPPLSIQPLVENAIRHGIRKKEHFGTVVLRVKEDANSYSLEVIDDGIGMETERIEKIMSDVETNEGSIGLANVRRRLKLLYGTELAISSEPGKGTCVLLTIPKEIRAK